MNDSYTIDDLAIMCDLRWRFAGWGHTLTEPQKSNLQYLIEKGHNPDKAADAAIKWDDIRYLTRYRPLTFDPGPELSRRDHLIQECGYDPEFVDTYLAEAEAKDAERERVRAEREAYEQTWRYKTIAGWRELRYRARAAWQIIRHGQEDDL